MQIRSKEMAVRADLAEVSDEDLALINERYALRPLVPEQVYVRRLSLCNDRYDRTGERFPRAYLERFAATLPGKPLLAHHNRAAFPLGRFFRAETVAEPTVPDPAEPARPVDDAGITTWLRCWFYLVRTPSNRELREQIDAGIYSHVSVGYRWADLLCDLCGRSYFRGDCPHLIGQLYDGRRCTATYGGDPERVEAVEASLVYLGAQFGAVVTKSDDREREKRRLAGCVPTAPSDDLLAAEGREYRRELREEIRRLAALVGPAPEVRLLLEGRGDPDAGHLRELRDELRARFDRLSARAPIPRSVPSASVPE